MRVLRLSDLSVPSLAMLGRILAVVLAVLGTGRLGIGILAWRAANALEQPEYSVIQMLGDRVELRQYSPYVVAETEIAASTMKAGTGKGFQTVAGYIFGKNRVCSQEFPTAHTNPPPRLRN